MAINGNAVLLFVYDKDYTTGAYSTDKYVPLGEQTSLSEELSANLIDASNKSSNFAKSIYGRQEGSISAEALYIAAPASKDEMGLTVLRNSLKQRKKVYVKRSKGDGTNFEWAECLVESISQEYPDDDVATISVELKMNGDWLSTAPTINAADVVGSN